MLDEWHDLIDYRVKFPAPSSQSWYKLFQLFIVSNCWNIALPMPSNAIVKIFFGNLKKVKTG